MEELQDVYPISKYFVGGHSQGGYLTYVMLMHYPDLIAGAFPIAGGVIIQAEPDVFEDEELRAQQRDTPLVIVHSKTDPNVAWSSSLYASERFMEEGWRAIRWLETMASEDAAKLHAFAATKIAEKAWAEACAALRRAVTIEGRDGSARTKELFAQVDAAARADAAKYEKVIEENADGSWIDAFLTFRDKFQHAPAAAKAMAAFRALREEHTDPANEARKAARAAFRRGDQDAGYAQYQVIVDSYYAAPRYRLTKRWIAERK